VRSTVFALALCNIWRKITGVRLALGAGINSITVVTCQVVYEVLLSALEVFIRVLFGIGCGLTRRRLKVVNGEVSVVFGPAKFYAINLMFPGLALFSSREVAVGFL
jgi:hypothetical protein